MTILSRRPGSLLALAIPAIFCLLATPVGAMLLIDFEQPYYVHPGMQVWDFSLIQHDGLFHIIYHGIPESDPDAGSADHIWRATSTNLIHWSEPEVILSISEEPYEELALWAPAVVHDEETGLWWMAYTGVDLTFRQRICMAWSRDLSTWHKSRLNPVVTPDPSVFHYPNSHASCRDPFLYRDDEGLWHILVTVKLLGMSGGQGAIARATSADLLHWSPLEVFLRNTGPTPTMDLESVQYHVVHDVHHLFFHEYATLGTSHLAATELGAWDFADRTHIDHGIAPEIHTFDGGQNYLLTRIGAYQDPGVPYLSWVARTDTLLFRVGTAAPAVHLPEPLSRDFASFTGTSSLGNPCFGDNPARRGEQPAAPVGNFYFGSKEYYGGPLSGRGLPGTEIGLPAQGTLDTYPFEIQGNSITMLVGGTYNPDHCFVALIDVETDSVLIRSTGHDQETMSPRAWDLRELHGRAVYLRIQDSDPYGFLNVDEIRESMQIVTTVGNAGTPAAILTDLGPRPNPLNPATVLHFELTEPMLCRVRIYDVRGRAVWDSQSFAGRRGPNAVTWPGTGPAGTAVAAGVYIYRLEASGRVMSTGKLMVVP